MRRIVWIFITFLFLMSYFLLNRSGKFQQQPETSDLWPPIEPYQTGYLRVSDLHEIYFEICGNPKGKPVFVLHGGPGGSCSPDMRRFFNPAVYRIILYDQRGAGRSKPYAELKDNTTWHLVEDIERLRNHLGVERMILFGGSWGSTLGLAYGEKYPDRVSGMVLRGIFTGTEEEIDHFYVNGVRKFFPGLCDSLLSAFPVRDKSNLPQLFFDRVSHADPYVRETYSKLWGRYEFKIGELVSDDAFVDAYFSAEDVMDKIYAFALFENYYMVNRCFLEEGQLLREADRLDDIPIVLINGRYDIICPPVTAYRLHQRLAKSRLVIAEGAGHWLGDKPVEKALLEAMIRFETLED